MGDRGSPARQAARLIANIYEAAGRLRRAGDAVARAAGQSQARWQVLSVVSEGRWTVPRIADRLGVTRQNVQRIADELERDGLVSFARNERHARSPFVDLTPAGRSVLTALTARALSLDARVAEAIGEAELERTDDALVRLLTRMRASD